MRAVLKYPGAKNRLAPWIVSRIPPHEVYCEPFFGSGGIFFAKPPARIETVNDIDGDVVNFFRVVRNSPGELARLLRLTPFARDEYEAAYEEDAGDSDIERARKFAVRCWQGFGCGCTRLNGFRSSQQGRSPSAARIWAGAADVIQEAASRLLNAQIENLPAAELIRRYDTRDVFLYVDPPYLPGTRKAGLYRHEMSADDHRELLALLVRHPGRVLISGYDSDLYREALAGWRMETRRSRAESGLARTECIWMNYDYWTDGDLFGEASQAGEEE